MRHAKPFAYFVLAASLTACVPAEDDDIDLSNCLLISSEDVSGGATLTKDCYIAEQSLKVGGGTLRLDPGVIISFAKGANLTVAGRDGGGLIAAGTEDDPVTLTGTVAEKGHWRGVYFDGSQVEDNALDWTVVEYAGASEIGSGLGQNGVGVGGFVGEASVSVTNSTFRHIDGHGVEVESESTLTGFAKNTFEDVDDFAVSIPAHQRGVIDAETTFAGEGEHAGVEVFGANVNSDQVWGPLSADAYTTVTGSVQVKARLEVEAGVELRFGDDVAFTIAGRDSGSLISKGSAEAPVLFTAQEQAIGAWRGIYFDGSQSSENLLDHTIVEYGGSTEFGSGLGHTNVGVGGFVGSSRISVTNSTFRHSAGHGLELEGEDVFLDFASNTFEGNSDYALSIPAEQRAMVDADTTFVGDTAEAYVEVWGGNVSTAGTWGDLKDDAFTAVTGNVAAHSRLVIEPGVALHFGDNVGFTVAGRDGGVLIAAGEADNKIHFTRLGGVQWKGIFIDNSESSENIISHSVIEYGGFTKIEGQKTNLFIGGFVGDSTIEVRDCAINNSDGYGIYVESGSIEGVNADIFTANTFADNADQDMPNVPAP